MPSRRWYQQGLQVLHVHYVLEVLDDVSYAAVVICLEKKQSFTWGWCIGSNVNPPPASAASHMGASFYPAALLSFFLFFCILSVFFFLHMFFGCYIFILNF